MTVGGFTQCSTQGSFARPWQEKAYNLLTFLGLFLLPLLVMVACYARILLEISRRPGSPGSGELGGLRQCWGWPGLQWALGTDP